MKLEIIIPCYNEAESIPKLLKELTCLKEKLIGYELGLVFVDDASIDGTSDLINQNFKNFDYKIMRHSENKNLGGAMRTGIGACDEKSIIGIIDADCSYAPVNFVKMLPLMNSYDIVSGSGILSSTFYFANIPFYRKIFSVTLASLYNIALFKFYFTYSGIFRLYRGSILKKINFQSSDFLAPSEIFVRAIKTGAKVKEIALDYHAPEGRISRARVVKTIRSHLGFILNLLLRRI